MLEHDDFELMHPHLEVDATPGVGVSSPQTLMTMWVSGLFSENLPRIREYMMQNPLGSRCARKWATQMAPLWGGTL